MTTIWIVLAPTDNAIGLDVVPEATAVPFTFMAALASAVTGFTVMDVVALPVLMV